MIKRFSLYNLPFLAVLCLAGCNSDNNPVPGTDEWKGRELNDHPTILVQDCNYLYLSLYKQNEPGEFIQIAEDSPEIESDKFAIRINIIGYSYDSINAHDFDLIKQYSRPSDPIIDEQLLGQRFKIPWGYYLEYRLEEVNTIIIMSNQYLFGKKPGDDISDKFVFSGCASGILPWLTKNKEFKGLIPNGTTISEYLYTEPFMFAEAFFLMTEKPKEVANRSKCSFTASIELKNGKVLTATSIPVTLI